MSPAGTEKIVSKNSTKSSRLVSWSNSSSMMNGMNHIQFVAFEPLVIGSVVSFLDRIYAAGLIRRIEPC